MVRSKKKTALLPSFSHTLVEADAYTAPRAHATSNRVPVTKEERLPLLIARREAKMTSSAHAYVRGSTHRFYDWLLSDRGATLPKPPDIWIGGDCHIGNVGAIARADGNTELELRDLDQTVIGSPAHDVVRLALSMAMAVRASALRGIMTLRAVENIARGYERALEARCARREAPLGNAPPQVAKLLRRAGHRSRKDFLTERIGRNEHQSLPIGKRFWPLTDDEWRGVEKLVESRRFHKLVTILTSRPDNAHVTLVDAAYWVKGCSSLGLWRAAVLVRVGTKKKGALALVDVKEARKTLAPRSRGAKIPAHEGERVVEGARVLSPYLGARMTSATVLDVPVFVRELLPQDMKFELDALAEEDVEHLSAYLGGVIGVAHARQLTPKDCADWLGTFRKEMAPRTGAPAWLWSAVVDLVALHEGAYLEHCREHEPEVARWLGEKSKDLASPHVSGD